MKYKILLPILLLTLVVLGVGVLQVASQDGGETQEPLSPLAIAAKTGTDFTYQGQLTDNNSPANGNYDFQFALYNALSNGSQVGSTYTRGDVPVKDGLFTVALDFGDVFKGTALYLEIRVRPGTSSGSYDVLTPRQELTAVPYAQGLKPGATMSASVNGSMLTINNTSATGDGLVITDAQHGINVESADGNGVRVQNSGGSGVFVDQSEKYGVHSRGNWDGVRGLTYSRYRYGGYFENGGGNIGSGDEGGGLYASGWGNQPDIVLGGYNASDPHGRIASDPAHDNSSLYLYSNDTTWISSQKRVVIRLDSEDGRDDAHFQIYSRVDGQNVTPFIVWENGTTSLQVLEINGGSDLSESFDINAQAKIEPEAGMVVCIDAENPGELIVCDQAYDFTVAGAVSGAGGVKPGMVMGQKGSIASGEHPVALTGRVYVNVDARYGAIQPGDLLTTSNTPGHAMKVTNTTQAQGAILGKAMTSLESGQGLVLVLVTLQ